MLAKHPANLALRFTLEVVALVAIIQWGFQYPAPVRYVLGIALPVLLMAAWALFRSPSDMIDVTKARYLPIPGALRLALEALVFGLAIYALLAVGQVVLAGVLVLALALHYFWSVERVVGMLRKPPQTTQPGREPVQMRSTVRKSKRQRH